MTIFRRTGNTGKTYTHTIAVILLAISAVLLPMQLAIPQGNGDSTNLDETFVLNLQNVDIRSLIETVSIRTGTNFIVDPRVKATVNVISAKPVNADRLYEMFLSVLQIHGYATVQAGKFIKIVPDPVGVRSAVPLLSGSSDAGDELVSQVIHLHSIPATQVVEALRPLLAQTASVSAESNSNAVVVTDRVANIEKLIELIILMDGR